MLKVAANISLTEIVGQFESIALWETVFNSVLWLCTAHYDMDTEQLHTVHSIHTAVIVC